MDRITKSILDEFIQDNGIQTLAEETAFEHFAGSLVVQSHYADSIASEDILSVQVVTVVSTALLSL